MAATDPVQLGCGRSIDDVYDHIGRSPDERESICPGCATARTDLGGLAQAAHDRADADRSDPTLPGPAPLTGCRT